MTTTTTSSIASDSIVTLDRRRGDRRGQASPQAVHAAEQAARQTVPAKKNRRRHIDPTTCERDYRQDELDFMRAMDDYKRSAGRMFPTCSEVLEVVRSLGYVRLNAEQVELLGDTLVEDAMTSEYLGGSNDDDDFDLED